MSVFHENMLIGASGQGAAGPTAGRSVRFNAPDSAYLNWTPAATASSSQKLTYSTWVKRSGLSAFQHFGLNGAISSTSRDSIRFDADNTISVFFDNGASFVLNTVALFRDCSAWYHIVVSIDTTQATASNRVKVYVNNAEQTLTGTQPTQNYNFTGFLVSSKEQNIGRRPGTSTFYYLNGYLAEIHCIDGQALTPSSFAETNATTGQWVPKLYSGTYGTNGFKLTFSDNSNTTAATLGADTSGNGNNWTPNNLSVTAGSGNDSLRDHPTSAGTDTGIGGEISGNYCTFNPLDVSLLPVTLLNGNLDYSSTTVDQGALGTFGLSSGKWYWEVVTTAGTTQTRAGLWDKASGQYYFSLSANNTVYGIRFDANAGTLDYTSNGSTWTSIATGLTSGPYYPYFENRGSTSKIVSVNFGQRAFSYTAPANYKVVCDTNLSTPTIAKPNTVMDVVTYTGTGSSLTPTSTLGFSPDLVWIKSRSAITAHALYNTVRGAGGDLATNSTAIESYQSQGLTAFNSNGFTIGTLAKVNTNASTYVAWCWDAGSSNATNTSGSINSTVRANTTAGFSVLTYVGTGANATVGHGLGVAPQFVVVKRLEGSSDNWYTWHTNIAATEYLALNSTAAKTTLATVWNSSAPTSTVFSIGTAAGVNASGFSYLAYCWTPVAGYSAFGSYTGNGSSDGPFVYTGFRPRWVMTKTTNGINRWNIYDATRDTYNVASSVLKPNESVAESTLVGFDFLSNGFRLRGTDSENNGSGDSYIYAAFAEAPFPYARAR